MSGDVELFEKLDGFEIFAAAVLVANPVAAFAAVVEEEHGGDGVDAEAVDVEVFEPEDGVRDEEGTDLIAAVVEDVGAPAEVFALAGIGVFVEGGAVKPGQAVGVFGEVTGDPIEEDADVGLMAGVDEEHEVFGRAEARGGGEEAGDLIAPGTAVGVLHDGHEFDVGVVETFDVFDEGVSELAVGEGLAVGVLHPAFKMDFVDTDRGFEPLGLFAFIEPRFVLPFVAGPLMDDAGGFGRDFGAEGVGIALELVGVVVTTLDAVLVDVARLDAGDEEFPDAAVAETHGMTGGIPVVENAGDGDGEGGGRPDGEADAGDVVDDLGVGAKGFPGAVEGAFGVKVEIEVGDDGAEAVGVVNDLTVLEDELIAFCFAA